MLTKSLTLRDCLLSPALIASLQMHRTRVKICGVMRPEDAAIAAAAGADAIGLIFHPPARRNIAPDRAVQIIAALPPFVTAVGVFADATPAQIIDIAAA